MQTALDGFEESMERVRALHGLHQSLSTQLTAAVDLSDLLRAEIVLAVSAFDFFVHELTRLGMMESHRAIRPKTSAFQRFPLAMDIAVGLTDSKLDTAIRERHGYQSFQSPDKVADAVRLFSATPLWDAIAGDIGENAKALKDKLSLIIDRRNKIAHEADLDPSFPGERWPIDRPMVEYALNFIEQLGRTIFKVTV